MFKKLFGGLMGKSAEMEVVPCFDQRRKTARRPCSIDVEGWAGRKNFFATVKNLGVAGMCLQCDTPMSLKQGAVLSLTYPEDLRGCETMTIEVLTRWTRVRESDSVQLIGVEFKDPKSMGRSWVKLKMKDLGFQSYNIKEQRKSFRLGCSVPGTIRTSAGSVTCVVRDIGLGGAFVELAKPLRAGAEVELLTPKNDDLPSGSLKGRVKHQQHADPSSPFGHGLAFDGVSSEQAEGIRGFLALRQEALWNKLPEYMTDVYTATAEDEADHSDVEIPDLASIMEETEPEEDEAVEGEEEQEGEDVAAEPVAAAEPELAVEPEVTAEPKVVAEPEVATEDEAAVDPEIEAPSDFESVFESSEPEAEPSTEDSSPKES